MLLNSGIEVSVPEGSHVDIPFSAITLGEIIRLESFQSDSYDSVIEESGHNFSEYAEVVQLRRKGNNDFIEIAIRTKNGTYKMKGNFWDPVTVFRLSTASVFNLQVGETIMLKYDLHPNHWDSKKDIAITASDLGCSARIIKISKNSSSEICKLTVVVGESKHFTFKIAVNSMVEVLR